MYIKNYKSIIKNNIIGECNIYNVFKTDFDEKVYLLTRFNTFKSEKSLKFIKLYKLFFLFSTQKPFLKKVKFNYIKKKILKRFFLCATLNKANKSNNLLYISLFYLYFFHFYYQKNMKYNHFTDKYILYLDNIQLFIKNYGKHAQKTQMQLMVGFNKNNSSNILFRYLSNLFLLELKKIK